jgi:hypothetical protein
MNASDANVSIASTTPRCGGLPPLAVPADAPAYAREMLRALDRAIMSEARCGPADACALVATPPTGETRLSTACVLDCFHGRDPRLAVAARMHAHADGATAFFLFHYLRLLGEQAEARAGGRPPPSQNWARPDGSPAPTAPRPPIRTDPQSWCASGQMADLTRPGAFPRNIAGAGALIAHGSG